MGDLIRFALYNPGMLSDEEFLAAFVARQNLTESLLRDLLEMNSSGPAKHFLILGQRGMGKTSLLRRLALGVAEDPELSARFLPLSFREEQYNVLNLHVFWCNCLDAFGDFLERAGRSAEASALDDAIAKVAGTRDDPEGNAAFDLFRTWTKREKKRPLLFLDNLDLILAGLEKQQWPLRRALQGRGSLAIVGAAVGFLEATARTDAPFYDFFRVTVLEKLTHPELIACLRRFALERGKGGEKVLRILQGDPARIHTLYDLTGGNPRTLVLLYLLLEMGSEGEIMSDLERLLDQVSALYKARVEDLPPPGPGRAGRHRPRLESGHRRRRRRAHRPGDHHGLGPDRPHAQTRDCRKDQPLHALSSGFPDR
jgi:hypothetical protein